MRKIKTGDEVIVVTGKDKGRRGTVLKLMPFGRIVVEGINVSKRHQRGNPQQGVPGGIVDKEMPIHVSNVQIYNPITKKGDRIGFRFLEDGKKVRFFKSTNEVVDV